MPTITPAGESALSIVSISDRLHSPVEYLCLSVISLSVIFSIQSPTFNKVFEVKAHSEPIDDIAVSTQDESIVTIAKDGKASVWNFDGEKVLDLNVELPVRDKYVYRNCRSVCSP